MGLARYEKFSMALAAGFVLASSLYFYSQHAFPQPYRVEMAAPPAQSAAEAPEPVPQEVWPESLLPGEVMDLNTAPAADLDRLPHIGEKRAEDIVAWREANGGFQSPEQLLEIPGIGEKTYEDIKDYVTVKPTDGGVCTNG